MKILVVNWRDIKNPEAGGAEVHIDEILKRKPAGWQVDFVASTYDGCMPEETINGYRVIRIPNKLFFHINFRKYWHKRLSAEGYDLVVDDVSKIPLATPRYIKGTPILAIDHHIHGKTLFNEIFFLFAAYVYLMERHYLRYYRDTELIACSESTRDELLSLYPYTRLQVLHNGIEYDYFAAHRAKKSPTPLIAAFGRMKRYKRIDDIIRAFALVLKELPQARLVIGGKGSDEERLKEIVKKMRLEKSVVFPGFADQEKMAEILSSAWLFAIASRKEGWAIVNLEANAAGTPVVGYDVEGVRNSVRNGETGFLVENGSVEKLAEKMLSVLSDSALRQKLSANAIRWASEFSWDKTAEKFYRIANGLIAQKHDR